MKLTATTGEAKVRANVKNRLGDQQWVARAETGSIVMLLWAGPFASTRGYNVTIVLTEEDLLDALTDVRIAKRAKAKKDAAIANVTVRATA